MEQEEQNAGSLIGIIIIIIIILAGGFYLWKKEGDAKRIIPPSQATSGETANI